MIEVDKVEVVFDFPGNSVGVLMPADQAGKGIFQQAQVLFPAFFGWRKQQQIWLDSGFDAQSIVLFLYVALLPANDLNLNGVPVHVTEQME